ncbi:orotate phosphoribosyltransferase [Hathewaya proteolytica DSM 3090]|uniref:Orotate phosphoribosyltransferase n=1 Tax=Hathewaya proteolytica DSM 3090 TaxID=1121331 RepID=A0A1M6N7J3_9CLOT|nr:orotate phosphoribosyltransferase [Hathewaya proteolytica]SHJ91526.1 orotate phosphoribosyltransferase [Hathewaya proteolytica DSM 3090]
MMKYKEEFIELMVEANVLRFGDFTAKSGRKTPYFINTGNYKFGAHISKLGEFYADCYHEFLKDDVNLLFGPAYKGIPLVVSASVALSNKYKVNAPICFNRKEAKDHGEGGIFVGKAPESGDNIVIIEDVITAGTAIRESMDIFKNVPGVNVTDLIIAVDRKEKGKKGNKSTLQELEEEFGIKVHPIVTIDDILEYLYNKEINGKVYIDDTMKARIEKYLSEYGAV